MPKPPTLARKSAIGFIALKFIQGQPTTSNPFSLKWAIVGQSFRASFMFL